MSKHRADTGPAIQIRNSAAGITLPPPEPGPDSYELEGLHIQLDQLRNENKLLRDTLTQVQKLVQLSLPEEESEVYYLDRTHPVTGTSIRIRMQRPAD